MGKTLSPVPATLSRESKAWYRRMAAEYGVTDAGGITLLTLAAEARNRMLQAAAAVAKDGMLQSDSYGRSKAHPLLAVERDARGQMLASLKALHLDVEPLKGAAGRPGGT
jgi:P27 family predicted phage terminase small subunit